MKAITENTLFYGDNLPILREYIPTESVDLIYLDTPFNSKRAYNVLFKKESGEEVVDEKNLDFKQKRQGGQANLRQAGKRNKRC